MKKLIIFLAAVFSMSITGCLKDSPNNDFSKIGTVVEMPNSGKGFFSADAITSTDDTITIDFTVNIASTYVLDKDLQVTIGVDPTLVAAYNAYDTSVHYEELPSDAYSFNETTITIPAGARLDTLQVVFYRAPLDPTKSYMLPITIKDASGQTISGNMGIHYYHFIGNPIAGAYTWDYTRWNNADGSGAPNGSSFTGESTNFLPISPTAIEVASGYVYANRYVLSFTNTDGVLSDFTISFNQDDVDYMESQGVTVTDGPHIITADPVNGVYEFQYQVFNGSAFRYFIEKYYK